MNPKKLEEALALALAGTTDAPGARPADAAGGGGASEILRLVERANDAQARKLSKVAPILRKAVSKLRAGDARAAGKLCVEAMNLDPENAVVTHVAAIAMGEMGAMRLAFDLYERAIQLDPSEAEVYHNLGLAAWSMEEFKIAEQFFRIFASMTPHSALAANNLAGALRDQGRHDEAIEILRAAIAQTPEDSSLWNTLGTILVEMGDDSTALTFYEEALRLDPHFLRARHNIAMAHNSLGEPEKAVQGYDAILPRSPNEAERLITRYSRAHALLACGRLAEGWADHEARLDPRFKRVVLFDVPLRRWDGAESFHGKRLLLIGEQGLGDEILFLSAAPDLIEALGPEGALTIVTEKRLVPLIQRSFPMADVQPHVTISINGRTIRGVPSLKDYGAFDFYAPMASILIALRPDLSAFDHQQTPFLTPDPARVAHYKARLLAAGTVPKAGFLWGSTLMTSKRKRYYAPFDSWRPALEAFNGLIVPMQYGDAAAQIARMREWNLPLLTFDDLDMKDDLDGVAALSAALNLVVGPPNASTNIAAGAGAPVLLLGEAASWPRLGADKLPWYPKSRFYAAKPQEGWEPALAALAKDLASFR